MESCARTDAGAPQSKIRLNHTVTPSISLTPSAVSLCYTGPHASTRRKTMMATWEAPGRSGEIYAELEFDMTHAKKFIEEVQHSAYHLESTFACAVCI